MKFLLVILNVTTTDISSIFFFTLKVKHFSDCSLKPALSYTSVNLCQITPVRTVELLGIYTSNSEQSLTLCGYRYALDLLHHYAVSRCSGTSTGEGKI